MRKVTQKAAQAMRDGQNMVSGNTRVHSNGGVMELHGNTIAIYDSIEGKLTLRDCGWQTVTTKERLNGILSTFSSEWRIYQMAGKWYITDGCGKREDWNGFLTLDV